MICFFWDLTSLRKSSMKSSNFGWDASFAVELLAASFLVGDEFCANAELVAANAINTRVIARHFFWFTGSFLTEKLEFGRECGPQLSTTWTLQHARFQSSHIVYLSIGAGLELSLGPLAAQPEFRKDQLAGRVL